MCREGKSTLMNAVFESGHILLGVHTLLYPVFASFVTRTFSTFTRKDPSPSPPPPEYLEPRLSFKHQTPAFRNTGMRTNFPFCLHEAYALWLVSVCLFPRVTVLMLISCGIVMSVQGAEILPTCFWRAAEWGKWT